MRRGNNNIKDRKHGEIVLYQAKEGQATVDVYLTGDTVWLTLNQMSTLFKRDKSVISRHLRNIFQTGELEKQLTVAKNATVQQEGERKVTRDIDWFNLDAIISVGYRVNSKSGTQFRIWATSILRDHLVKGYTVNQRRLVETGISEAQQVLAFLSSTLVSQNLITDEGQSVLDVVNHYAKTWQLLWQYDEDNFPAAKPQQASAETFEVDMVRTAIDSLKSELTVKGEATDIFGNERNDNLAGIIGAIQQTFGGQDLYPSTEEKAANLLYFVVKDHPFTDGNKRIGSFLFILFLQMNGLLDKRQFDTRALVALTLLTAASDPRQKDVLIRLIVNLLSVE